METKTILITGGSGFIGTTLTRLLLDKGYGVVVVDILKPNIRDENFSFIPLDITKEKLPSDLDGKIHGVIHLAGKNIFGRWTASYKKEIYENRH